MRLLLLDLCHAAAGLVTSTWRPLQAFPQRKQEINGHSTYEGQQWKHDILMRIDRYIRLMFKAGPDGRTDSPTR